jgi:Spy/CpxP family protein refolding chaperone
MSDSRARVWFALFVLAVFCLGAASGIVIGRHLGPPRSGPGLFGVGRGPGPLQLEGPPGRGGPPMSTLVQRLASELQLDDAQTAQIRTIMNQRRDRLEQVHREARERFAQEQRELHAAIRAVLRPDQQQKFDRFLEHRR